jgi:hypothetical protein
MMMMMMPRNHFSASHHGGTPHSSILLTNNHYVAQQAALHANTWQEKTLYNTPDIPINFVSAHKLSAELIAPSPAHNPAGAAR